MPTINPKTVGDPKIDASIFDIYRILNWLRSEVEKVSKKITGIINQGVSSAILDHALLNNLNSTNYSHLTAADKTDLTDGGTTTLHSHAADHAAATVADTSTVDMSISGQQISAVTIGLTGTITFASN